MLCFALVGAGILAMICALLKFDISNLYPVYDNVSANPHHSFMGGALSILASVPFFLAGFETIPQGIENAGGNVKSVGKTVILTVFLSCLFYALLLVTLGSAYPWKEFIEFGSPSAALLFKEIYSGTAGTFLYLIILIGAICGLLTTWNGFMMASSQILMAMSRVSIVPNLLSKQDPKYGTPTHALKVSLAASVIGPFLGGGLIGSLTTFSAAGYVVSWMITAFCLIKLRYTEPKLKRPYKIPGGVKTAWLAGITMAVFMVLLFIPGQPVYIGTTAICLFVGWMCIGVILYVLDYNQRKRYSQLKRASFLFASMASTDIKIPAFIDMLEDDYRIISFVVPNDADYAGQNLTELGWGKAKSIFIIKIERGTYMLMLPSGNAYVYENDRVFAMGFGETEKQSPLTCIEIRVNGDKSYCGQSIKNTSIQSKEQCMII